MHQGQTLQAMFLQDNNILSCPTSLQSSNDRSFAALSKPDSIIRGELAIQMTNLALPVRFRVHRVPAAPGKLRYLTWHFPGKPTS